MWPVKIAAMRNFCFLSIIILLTGCGGISFLKVDPADLYSEEFLKQIQLVKEQYKRGEADQALTLLKGINEETLASAEKSFRRNLIGVILFSKKNYEQAIYNFELALSISKQDYSLTAQVYLNLASCYFKLGLMEKAYGTLDLVEVEYLNKADAQKNHLLRFELAKELDKEEDRLKSLVLYLSSETKLNDLKNNRYFEYLVNSFFKLNKRGKVRFLEEFEENQFLCISYLGYLEIEKLYYGGYKDDAKDLLEWVQKRSGNDQEIQDLLGNFVFRIGNFLQMDSKAIGIILPLSGGKKNFGKRALLGIDTAIISNQENHQLHIKDSQGSGAVGAFRVRELIENYHVSAIIGGLFSQEATKEYLEAKKYGVLFISLSQVYLPKNRKDHLLIEVPGSIESQMNRLFAEDMLNKFGRRSAIVYPKSERGDAYIDEFWRKAQLANVEVTGVLSYDKSQTDYRGPIKNLLGLEFTRERKEELDLLSEIHSLEKSRSVRRIQTLRPQLDFDWLFVPAFPQEAIQILPSFNYYDAFDLNLIGDPSWRSQSLAKNSSKFGNLFFIGDDVSANDSTFSAEFLQRHKKRPKMIEMRAYDSLQILRSFLGSRSFATRDDFDIYIRNKKIFEGITGKWFLDDGIWIKQLVPLKLRSGRIENIFDEA